MSRLNSLVTWQGLAPISVFGTLATYPDYKSGALSLSPTLHPGRQHKESAVIDLFFVVLVLSLDERISLGDQTSKPWPWVEF